jgi:hypothetical protein
MSPNTNETAPNKEHEPKSEIDWNVEAAAAKKEGNKLLYTTIMRRVFGRGKHFQQKGTKGAFGKFRAVI